MVKVPHLVELIEAGEHEGDLILVYLSESEIRKLRDQFRKECEIRTSLDFIGFLHQKGVEFIPYQYDILDL